MRYKPGSGVSILVIILGEENSPVQFCEQELGRLVFETLAKLVKIYN